MNSRTMRIAGMAAVAMVSCLVWAGSAGATGPLTNDYVTLQYSSVTPREAAQISVDSGVTWLPTGSGYLCGQYNLLVSKVNGSYAGVDGHAIEDKAWNTGSKNGIIGTFCIDIREEAPGSMQPYDIYALENAPIGYTMGLPKANDLRRLFTLWKDGTVLSGLNSDERAGAFQAATWEIINETSGNSYGVFTGTFRMKYYWGSGWLSSANTLLTMVSNADLSISDPNYHYLAEANVLALVNVDTQDYALYMGAGGAPVPEPVTMAGLMMGLGGLVTYVRKRRAA